MNRTISTLIIAGALGFGLQALADTPPDQAARKSDQQQFMKDCIAKAKAANNGMSEKDMHKACMDQWKAAMGNPNQPITPAH